MMNNTEIDLKSCHKALVDLKKELEQKNIALREMITQVELEHQAVQQNIKVNVERILFPLLAKIKPQKYQQKYFDLVKKSVEEISAPFGRHMIRRELNLTTREIEISNMIKSGLTSKEIARMLFISTQTIEKHRKNIRKKIGISNTSISLVVHLNTN